MKTYDEFHDGRLDGVWVDSHAVYLFFRTDDNRRFAAVAQGAPRLNLTDFREGNIIFEVIARDSEELTTNDIASVHILKEGKDGEEQAANFLAKARQGGLCVLEINPSYGAMCTVLAHSIEIITHHEWATRYMSSLANIQQNS